MSQKAYRFPSLTFFQQLNPLTVNVFDHGFSDDLLENR